jgi:hypothetical protein
VKNPPDVADPDAPSEAGRRRKGLILVQEGYHSAVGAPLRVSGDQVSGSTFPWRSPDRAPEGPPPGSPRAFSLWETRASPGAPSGSLFRSLEPGLRVSPDFSVLQRPVEYPAYLQGCDEGAVRGYENRGVVPHLHPFRRKVSRNPEAKVSGQPGPSEPRSALASALEAPALHRRGECYPRETGPNCSANLRGASRTGRPAVLHDEVHGTLRTIGHRSGVGNKGINRRGRRSERG